jgi:hypothetical protein
MLDAGCWMLDATNTLIVTIIGQGVRGGIQYLVSSNQHLVWGGRGGG